MGQKAYVSLYTLLQTQHIRVGKLQKIVLTVKKAEKYTILGYIYH